MKLLNELMNSQIKYGILIQLYSICLNSKKKTNWETKSIKFKNLNYVSHEARSSHCCSKR